MRSRHLFFITVVISALTILAAHLREPALLPAPAQDSLAYVQGRVLRPASPCGRDGGKRTPGGFVLTLTVDNKFRDLRLTCNEELRVVAVGGTEVELWLEEHRWPAGTIYQIWAANVDGHPVIRYDDSVDFHNRTPERLGQAYAIAFVVECVIVYFLLHALNVMWAARRRDRAP